MTLEEQKQVEDHLERLLSELTQGEKAVLYKTLYAQGLKIAACDTLIRKEPAPAYTREKKDTVPLNRTTGDWHRGALADRSRVLTL